MRLKQANRATLLLSFLVLITRGEGISYKNNGQSNTHIPYGLVNKTIQLKDGDVFDCIDVNLQPSLNHPRMKDHKIQLQPSSIPVGLETKPQFPHSASQVQPSIMDCPVGTVPILRNSRSGTIAIDSIYGASRMGIEREAAGVKYSDDVYGLSATINVWEPKLNKASKDFSASWVHINNGVGEHTDRIGAGLMVYPSFSGDTFVRFHISWTEGVDKKACMDHSCLGFVQVIRKWGLGARINHVSVYDGPQFDITFNIFKDQKTRNWWVTYGKDHTPIGYWPTGLFMFLDYKGTFAFWGGIVRGPTASSNAPPMGSGHFASEGHRRAACINNMQIVNENNTYVTPEDNFKVDHVTTNSTLYTVDNFQLDLPGGMSVLYGGPGLAG